MVFSLVRLLPCGRRIWYNTGRKPYTQKACIGGVFALDYNK